MKIEKRDKPVPIKPLVNKVAQSGLITIDLDAFYPQVSFAMFDIKDFLFRGLVLYEKKFREAIAAHDWTPYRDKVLLVTCTADAIIPMWAYMLIGVSAADYAKEVFHGTEEEYIRAYYDRYIAEMDVEKYRDQRVILKGCGKNPIPPTAYMQLARKLKPVAKRVMFGEACSTVPIYRRKE